MHVDPHAASGQESERAIPVGGIDWKWDWFWRFGGIYGPLACLVLELIFGFCRTALFDPLPTIGHGFLVAVVPVSVFCGMEALAKPTWRTRATGVLLGSAACTTLMFAVPFVPLVPISLWLLLCGIGLLGLAPLVAPLAVLSLALRLRRGGLPGLWTGFLGSIALLALLDLAHVRTILGVQAALERPEDASRSQWLLEHANREVLEELGRPRYSARPLAALALRYAPVDPSLVRENWRRWTGEPPPYAFLDSARD